MSVYFDYQIKDDASSSSDHSVKTHLAWHSTYPVLAVAVFSSSRGGAVKLFNDQGKVLGSEIRPVQDSAQGEVEEPWWSSVSTLAWHPTKRFLAIAWEKGDITIWNDHESILKKCEDQRHKDAVHVIKWSLFGSRIMSADNYGSCVSWKVDDHAEMTVVFHHDLKESVSQLTFKSVHVGSHGQINREIRKLAKAAINGNDAALDMFVPDSTGVQGPNAEMYPEHGMPKFTDESFDCYVGASTGSIYHINGNGSCTEVGHNVTSIYRLLYYSEHDILVVATSALQLITYQSSFDGSLNEVFKIKVISKVSDPEFTWCGPGILAMTCGQNFLRIFNIDANSSYVLNMDGLPANQFNEVISCIAYANKTDILAAGTNMGTILTWEYQPGLEGDENYEDQWKLQTPNSIRGTIKQIVWGLETKCLAVNTQQHIYLLHQHLLCAHFSSQVSCVQTSANQLCIDDFAGRRHMDLKTEIQICGLYVTSNYITVWSKEKLVVYEYDLESSHANSIGNFESSSRLVAMNEQSLFIVDKNNILVTTIQGTTKQALVCSEEEGQPSTFNICNNILVVGCAEGFIKTWDLSRREVKPHTNPKCILEHVKKFKGFHSVKINCNGTKISFIVYTQESSSEPDSKLYVWDLEGDCFRYFDLKSGKSDDDANLPSEEDLSPAERLRSQAAKDVKGRFPKTQFWDPEEPRLLICEAFISETNEQTTLPSKNHHKSRKEQSRQQEVILPATMVMSLFVTTEHGIMIQDRFPLEERNSQIIGVHVPYYYIHSRETFDKSKLQYEKVSKSEIEIAKGEISSASTSADRSELSNLVKAKSMRDFVGLEMSDTITKEAMMNFCFYLNVGNMDEAFKAIKAIRSENVWENMAKMCVKTKRLDVASVCLGKMGHAHGAKALREAMATQNEEDARVAILAVHLGMLDEAEELYKACGRYDLLNKLYQDSNEWEKALNVAEVQDRINLRTTFYNYAKHLESTGNTRAAISFFESSETHQFEVPRMLLDDPENLDEYIQKSKNIQLWRWWAQYMESTGEMETALRYYEAAQDHLALVRVYCYLNNLEKAADIANDSGDKLACFHLGRQHENNGNIKEAIHFFVRAHAYSNAVRLCKENGLEDQLLNLALMSGPEGMIDAARYYEIKEGLEDKAVMLYHKAGYLNKAVELAFRVKQFSTLQHIANDLDDKADPELLKRCAEFFIENGHFDRAVDLLSIAKKYHEALDLCIEHHVTMTEKLAERLTPPKMDQDKGLRLQLLERIAECAMSQDNYHLATKKFTQAGNKVQAMKSLLKSGDTEKIVFFAGVSRQKEIYIMAANYLQSLDWKKDPEVMKNIISFYSKGRALDLLSSFYEACAQVEMDEYQNYEKALGALNEAFKCLNKAPQSAPQYDQKVTQLKMKMELVRKYVQATRLYDEDPEEAMKMCKLLLQEEMLDVGVRSGDVYSVMIEHYVKMNNLQVAHALIEEMRVRIPNVNLSYYINPNLLQIVYSSLGLPLPVSQVIENEEVVQSRPQTAIGFVEEAYDSDEDQKGLTSRDSIYQNSSGHFNLY